MRRHLGVLATAVILESFVLSGCADTAPGSPTLILQSTGTNVRLQAVSAVDERVVWASGLDGTVVVTTNGGQTWNAMTVPGAETLQFRDVDAFDDHTAYLLSSGSGNDSRIYKTSDGGTSWALQYTNTDPDGFFDCMALWDMDHGAVYGDAVDGSLVILTTADGENWTRVPRASLPEAVSGEGGFAASGTCLISLGDSIGWIGTGAGTEARIIKTTDRGQTWSAFTTPIGNGSGTSGITTVGFYDHQRGIAAGGDISRPDEHSQNVVVTSDGGVTWELAGQPILPGAIYGLAVVPGAATSTVVAVGPGGADYSLDNGATWSRLDSLEYWSVAFASPRTGWAVGPNGRIAKILMN